MKLLPQSRTSLFNDVLRNFLFKERLLSIVQLSRFLSFSFKRQLRHSIKAVFVCQELFFDRFRPCLPSATLNGCLPSPGRSASASPVSWLQEVFSHQRQVLSYHHKMKLSTFFLFFIYFRQFIQFLQPQVIFCKIFHPFSNICFPYICI